MASQLLKYVIIAALSAAGLAGLCHPFQRIQLAPRGPGDIADFRRRRVPRREQILVVSVALAQGRLIDGPFALKADDGVSCHLRATRTKQYDG